MLSVHERLAASLADRYRIERGPEGDLALLGRGGTATVYLAHDLRHDRLVALKVVHPELAVSVEAERFLREIRFVARLSHPKLRTLLSIPSGISVSLLRADPTWDPVRRDPGFQALVATPAAPRAPRSP
jgi:serine/threonine-protein kinase